LIEDEMMLVRADDRSSSKTIYQKLDGMHRAMMRDADYYQKPCKTSRNGKTQLPLKAKFKTLPPREKQTRKD
jgi:dsDNA-specific endonuclease/ATPase MutS2